MGSACTITGNPQNIIIGSASGLPYLTFLARLAPISLIGLMLIIMVVRWVYGKRMLPPSAIDAPADATLPRAAIDLGTACSTFYAPVLTKSLIVIVGMLIAFLSGLSVPLAAYLAACALLFTRRIKSDKILNLVDWPLLLLFVGLFIVTGALELTGVSALLFAQVSSLAQAGVAPLTLVITVLSNTISNVQRSFYLSRWCRNLQTPFTLG